MVITKQSSCEDVISFLQENNLDDLVEEFQANEVDGEDFFGLEMQDVLQMIPRLKLRKKFISIWSEVTQQEPMGFRTPLNNVTTGVNTPRSEFDSSQSQLSSISGSKSNQDSDREVSTCVLSKRTLIYEESTPPRKEIQNQPKQTNLCLAKSKENKSPSQKQSINESEWLRKFCLPTRWEPAVENSLQKGYLTPQEKCALNRQLTSSILAHTESPSIHARNHIARLLVQKYPCLKGSYGAGHQIWAKKIEDRVLNLRRRAAKSEKRKYLEEGVLIPKSKPGRKRSKKETSVALPVIPDGETEATIEAQRKELVVMFNNRSTDLTKIKLLMDNTFAHRRKEVLMKNIRVWKLLNEYPFLKDCKGVELKAELERILDKDEATKEMKECWNLNKQKILSALKKSKVKEVHDILEVMEDCLIEDEKEIENRCIMASLPHVLGDKEMQRNKSGELFWEIVDDDSTEGDVTKKIENCTSPKLLSTGTINQMHSLILVAEGMVVAKLKNLNILNAVICLLSAYYVFNAEYPKDITGHSKNVFLFLEHLFIPGTGKKKLLPMSVENFISCMK